MTAGSSQLAFIGMGGPELIVVMLVLIMVFGAKDAPKMFRKINEFLSTIRNTADSFKREIMYSDLDAESTSADDTDDYDYSEDYHDDDYDYYDDGSEQDYSDETFQNLEKDLEDSGAEKLEEEPEPEVADTEDAVDGDDDAQKA